MLTFLNVYYCINLLLGVVTIWNNPINDAFNLYHWPSIIYIFIFNAITIIWQCFYTYNDWQRSIVFDKLAALKIVGIIGTSMLQANFFLCILQNWYQRHQLYILLKNLQNIIVNYFTGIHSIRANPLVKRKIYKLAIYKLFNLIVLIISKYSEYVGRVKYGIECQIRVCGTYYKLTRLFGFYKNWFFIFWDINIYIFLVLVYMCVNLLIERLKKIEVKIQLMQNSQNPNTMNPDNHQYNQNVLRQEIIENVKTLGLVELNLKNITEKFVRIFQWQLLLHLLSLFLTIISFILYFMYNIIIFFTINIWFHAEPYKQLFELSFIVLTMLSNILLLFNICELLIKSFKEFSQFVHRVVVYFSLTTRDDITKHDELLQSVSCIEIIIKMFKYLFLCSIISVG